MASPVDGSEAGLWFRSRGGRDGFALWCLNPPGQAGYLRVYFSQTTDVGRCWGPGSRRRTAWHTSIEMSEESG